MRSGRTSSRSIRDRRRPVTLNEPTISIHWRQSVGTGQLVVTGSASKAALLKLEFRRPSGGPLITQQQSVPAGPFRLTRQISAAALPNGADACQPSIL
jgi:hypothetical protein